jgi:hypothetical protein
VFIDRYHATQIHHPRQARNALAYVLNNWRKHREDLGACLRQPRIDRYSSAVWFADWAELDGGLFSWPKGYEPLAGRATTDLAARERMETRWSAGAIDDLRPRAARPAVGTGQSQRNNVGQHVNVEAGGGGRLVGAVEQIRGSIAGGDAIRGRVHRDHSRAGERACASSAAPLMNGRNSIDGRAVDEWAELDR